MARHAETAFIPMNDARHTKGKPWFAIACLAWTASMAREALTKNDPRGHKEAWRLSRKDGWHIVKVRVTVDDQ